MFSGYIAFAPPRSAVSHKLVPSRGPQKFNRLHNAEHEDRERQSETEERVTQRKPAPAERCSSSDLRKLLASCHSLMSELSHSLQLHSSSYGSEQRTRGTASHGNLSPCYTVLPAHRADTRSTDSNTSLIMHRHILMRFLRPGCLEFWEMARCLNLFVFACLCGH